MPVRPVALSALNEDRKLAPHGHDRKALLFQPTQARRAGWPHTGNGIYKLARKYISVAGVPMERIVHVLRATAATNAVEREANIARVQNWLSHSNVGTTRLYDRPERRLIPHPVDTTIRNVSVCSFQFNKESGHA